MALINVHRYLRFKPFDISTETGRTSERYRLAAWAVLANVASKAAALAVMVLGVSLTIPYLGPQRFGIWTTVASFSGMLSFLGLGVGNALTNRVARCSAQDEPLLIRRAISGGLGILMLLGAFVGGGLAMLASWLPWASLINVYDAELLAEARNAAQVFAVLFGLNIFTTGIQSVFAGLQRSFEVYLVSTLGSVFALFALWMGAQAQAGIPILLVSTLGVQSLTSLLLMALLLMRKLFFLNRIDLAIQQEASGLLRVGGLFFILQISTMVGWGADALIISSAIGPAQVAAYAITQRLFQFVVQPLAIINSPLWGAYADAHAKGDLTFVGHTLKKSMLLTLSVSTFGVLFVFLISDWALNYWTHSSIHVPSTLVFWVAVWTIFECCGGAFGVFLNAMQVVRQQVFVSVIFCALVLPLKLVGIEHFGITAIPLAAIGAYAITHFVMYGIIFAPGIKLILAESSGK